VPEEGGSTDHAQWQLGDLSDEDEDVDTDTNGKVAARGINDSTGNGGREEGHRLIEEDEEDRVRHRRSISSDATLHARNDEDDEDEFGEWNDGDKDYRTRVM